MTVEVEPISLSHISAYAKRLDAFDHQTLTTCARLSSHLWVGRVNYEIACLWGVCPPSIMSGRAYLWLYTTPLVEEHQFLLVRYSQRAIQEILKEYDSIYGHVAVDNPRGFRWIKWLGATFAEPQGKMIPFMIRKKHG